MEFRINKTYYHIGLVVNFLLLFMYIGFITLPMWILKYKHTYIAVNDKTVTTHSGIFNKKQFDTVISRIDSVEVNQSFIGRKIGYGDVIITSGTSKHINKHIERPHELKSAVEERYA